MCQGTSLKPFADLEVIQQSSRRGYKQVYSLYQFVYFRSPVRPPHDNSERLRVVCHQIFRDTEYLQGKLAGR